MRAWQDRARLDDITMRDASAHLLIRYCRRWVAARELGHDPRAALVRLAQTLGHSTSLPFAFDALFQLAEDRLERPIRCGCCASPILSGDEQALRALYAITLKETAFAL